jgi:hypothetical protein
MLLASPFRLGEAPSHDDLRARVVELIHSQGLQATCTRLGLAREQVLRIAAGVSARRGTILAAANALGLIR